MNAELTSSNFWSDSGWEWVLPRLYLQGRISSLELRVRWWSHQMSGQLLLQCHMCMTKPEHLVGTPRLCPCLHCFPGGQAVRAQLLLLLSKRSCGISHVLSAAFKNIDTPDHYFFKNIFNSIYIGNYSKPIKLHADGPGGGSSSLCCIQAFPLASVFEGGLKWYPELDSLPPYSSRCAHKPKQTPLFQAHL